MTSTLIKNAQERAFTDFDKSTKEILSTKIAQKLQEKGYFDRLDNAKVNEASKVYATTSELGDLYDLGEALTNAGLKEGKDWDYSDSDINKDRYWISLTSPKAQDKAQAIGKKANIKVNIKKMV